MIGKVIGNYRIVRELGSGAMGAVFEGVDTMIDRRVAVKMLRAEIARQPDLIERFRSEAVTLARLNHPSIAMLYSFFHEGEDYYMVMEFVPGRTLEVVLRQSGRLTPEIAVHVVRQVLDGMEHAHQAGVLHRDVKPANIMVASDGHVKVTDFGIARVLGASRMTREGRIIGTLEYMAPERIRGDEADARSDLYSVGVVLYECLSGRLPFAADTDFGIMHAHLEKQLPPLDAGCPPALEAIVNRALAKSPGDRFQTATEFREALSAIIPRGTGLKPTRLASVAPPPPARAATRRTPLILAAAALVAVILIAALGVALWMRRSRPAAPQQAVVTPPPVVVSQPAATTPAVAIGSEAGFTLPEQAPGVKTQPEPVIGKEHSLDDLLGRQPKAPTAKPVVRTTSPPVSTPPPTAAPPPTPVASTPATPPALPAKEEKPEPPPAPVAAPARPTPRTISDVRRLFIAKMPNDLDTYIRTEIQRQIPTLAIALKKDDADAIMHGTAEDRSDVGARVTGGYLGMKDKVSASVTITDLSGNVHLWASEAGDKTPVVGVLSRGGPKKVADRLVSNLKKAMQGKR